MELQAAASSLTAVVVFEVGSSRRAISGMNMKLSGATKILMNERAMAPAHARGTASERRSMRRCIAGVTFGFNNFALLACRQISSLTVATAPKLAV